MTLLEERFNNLIQIFPSDKHPLLNKTFPECKTPVLNNRFKRVGGQATTNLEKNVSRYLIEINPILLETPYLDNILLHEMLHIYVEHYFANGKVIHHGKIWKSIAKEFNIIRNHRIPELMATSKQHSMDELENELLIQCEKEEDFYKRLEKVKSIRQKCFPNS